MKKLLLLALFFPLNLWAASSRLTDGKINFAVSVVNGVTCWTAAEKTAEINKYNVNGATTALIISDTAATNFEVSLTTAGIKYENYTDYLQCLASTDHLADKLDDIPPSVARKNKRTLDYLRLENSKR